jgi:hypothetical protein
LIWDIGQVLIRNFDWLPFTPLWSRFSVLQLVSNSIRSRSLVAFSGPSIDQQFSAPRVLQQNGVVEQKNRTLVEMARTMLDEHGTPRRFWADAISTACYVSNWIFLRSILLLTPSELRFG